MNHKEALSLARQIVDHVLDAGEDEGAYVLKDIRARQRLNDVIDPYVADLLVSKTEPEQDLRNRIERLIQVWDRMSRRVPGRTEHRRMADAALSGAADALRAVLQDIDAEKAVS